VLHSTDSIVGRAHLRQIDESAANVRDECYARLLRRQASSHMGALPRRCTGMLARNINERMTTLSKHHRTSSQDRVDECDALEFLVFSYAFRTWTRRAIMHAEGRLHSLSHLTPQT
jgi:hypothetical protein